MSEFKFILSAQQTERINGLPSIVVFDMKVLMETPDATKISEQNRSLLNEIRTLTGVYVVILSPYDIATTVGMVGIKVGLTYVGAKNRLAYGPLTLSDPGYVLPRLSGYELLDRLVKQYHAKGITIIGAKRFARLFIGADKLSIPSLKVMCVREKGVLSKLLVLTPLIDVAVTFAKIPQLIGEIHTIYQP